MKKKWIEKGLIQKVEISENNLNDLLRLIDRDIKDSQIEALSTDRRFATAYGAALNLASYVLRRAGYRVTARSGHHILTFQAMSRILGPDSKSFVTYFFDRCRRKRNSVDYDTASVITETELLDLIEIVMKFKEVVNKFAAP